MTKTLTLQTLILLIATLSINAQNIQKDIEKQFIDYSTLIIEKKFDKALDYTNEEFFKIIPREQFLMLLTKTMNSTEMEYKAHIPSVSNFDSVKNINSKNYVKFISHSNMEVKMNEKEEDKNKSEDEKKLSWSLYKLSLENTFGPENVKFNESTKFFEIKTHKKVIATSDDKMKDWKFVIVENDRQKKILERFIPSELLKDKN